MQQWWFDLANTSKQVIGTYYEGRTANVHERWKTIKATNEFWIFKLGSDSNEILSIIVKKNVFGISLMQFNHFHSALLLL